LVEFNKQTLLDTVRVAVIKEAPELIKTLEVSFAQDISIVSEPSTVQPPLPHSMSGFLIEADDEAIALKKQNRKSQLRQQVEVPKIHENGKDLMLSVSDFKDALTSPPKQTSLLNENDSTPHVSELLKSLKETIRQVNFNYSEQSEPKSDSNGDIGEHDLDWLKSRSRQVSNQTGLQLSQKKSKPVKETFAVTKRREPAIFDLEEDV
jgi:hypothetical protein